MKLISIPYLDVLAPVLLQAVEPEAAFMVWHALDIEVEPLSQPYRSSAPADCLLAWQLDGRLQTTERFVRLTWEELKRLAAEPVAITDLLLAGVPVDLADEVEFEDAAGNRLTTAESVARKRGMLIEAVDCGYWAVLTSSQAIAMELTARFPTASVNECD